MKKSFTKICIISFVAFLLSCHFSFAVTKTSFSSGIWSNPGTWVGGIPPAPTDDVVIAFTHTVTVNSSPTCQSVQLRSSSALINTGTLTVNSAGVVPAIYLKNGTTDGLCINNGSVVINNAPEGIASWGNSFTFINTSTIVISSSTYGIDQCCGVTGFLFTNNNTGSITINIPSNGEGIFDVSTGSVYNNYGVITFNNASTSAQPFSIDFSSSAGSTFNNYGTITSFGGDGIDPGSSGITINNYGIIDIDHSSAAFPFSIYHSSASTSIFNQFSGSRLFVEGMIYNLVFNASAADNIVTYDGKYMQQPVISPSDGSYYDLVINSTYATSPQTNLFTNITISDNLSLVAGALYLGNGGVGKALTITNPNITAISGGSTTSYLKSELSSYNSKLQWNIGNAAAGSNYIVPFGYNSGGTDYYIPFTYSITTAGTQTANGNLTLATYHANLNAPLPPGGVTVTNEVPEVDRFWSISLNNYSTVPTSAMSFGYSDPEASASGENLQGVRWNTTTTAWDEPLPGQTNNTVTNIVTVPNVYNYSTWTLASFPTVSLGPDQTICNGTTLSLTASGAGATDYAWLPVSGLTPTSGQVVSATPNTTTNYTVTASNGSWHVSDNINITVNPTPTVSVSSNNTICSGTAYTLTGSGADQYSWSPNTGLSPTTGSSVQAFPPTGTITYTVTGTYTLGGCTNAQTVSLKVNPLPTITATTNLSVCDGSVAELTAGPCLGLIVWSPEAGLNTGTGCDIMCIVSPGSYSYSVTAYDGTPQNCSYTVPVNITVNPLPTISLGLDKDACTGVDTQLSITGSAGTYVWQPAANLTNTNSNLAIFNSGTEGLYSYTATITDANNCSASDDIKINVVASLTANAGTDMSICSGQTTFLSAFGGSTYTWSPATGISAGTSDQPLFTQTTPGSYSYTLTAMSGSYIDIDSITITVNPLPTLTSSNNSTICDGNAAELTVGGASTYNWNPNTNLIPSTGSSVSATPNSATTYTITGTDANGCNNQQPVTITVNVNPLPTITATSNLSVCDGSVAMLTAGPCLGLIVWSPEAGLNTGTGCSVMCLVSSGQYSYSVTAYDGTPQNCSYTVPVTITVTPQPTIYAGSDATINAGESYTINDADGNASTYSWAPASTIINPDQLNPTINPLAPTFYIITASNNSCISSDSMYINVIQCKGTLFIPTAFSPNSDTYNDSLKIYGGCFKQFLFQVFDRWGNKIFETADQNMSWDGKYKGQALATGVFVYRLSGTGFDNSPIDQKGNITLAK